MKHIIITLLFLLFPVLAMATSDLPCSGKEYDIYLGVGIDKNENAHVGFATITNKKTQQIVLFYSAQIKTVRLSWPNVEENFSRNSMNVELTNKDGITIKITAKGSVGQLHYKSKLYKLDCNWER